MAHDKTFFQNLGISWFRVWENVPNVHFFIKDLDGRIMACNRRFAVLMGGTCEEDILHKTAFDLCSRDPAIRYTEDDQRVFAGEDILDQFRHFLRSIGRPRIPRPLRLVRVSHFPQ